MFIHDLVTLLLLAKINPQGCVYTKGLSSGREWYDHAECFANAEDEDPREIFNKPDAWMTETHDGETPRSCMYCRNKNFTPWPDL